MTPAAPSPFLEIPSREWLCANALCFAIFDRFPVSPGHVLVITRRVVSTFFECTPDEQAALMQLVGEVRTLQGDRPCVGDFVKFANHFDDQCPRLYFRFNSRSYSLWCPIQNHTRSDPSSTATAR
jgi:hypothetical protein